MKELCYLRTHPLYLLWKFKEDSSDHSILQVFVLCLKRNDTQTCKSSYCKKSCLQYYFIDTACFDKCILCHVMTGRHVFYKILSLS